VGIFPQKEEAIRFERFLMQGGSERRMQNLLKHKNLFRKFFFTFLFSVLKHLFVAFPFLHSLPAFSGETANELFLREFTFRSVLLWFLFGCDRCARRRYKGIL
jgi:hypothetical protein